MTAARSTEILIVGAGIAGITTALALAREGARVTVVDRGAVCSGSSGLNAGGLRKQFTQASSVAAAKATLAEMATFQEEYGVDPAFREAGYLFLHAGGRNGDTLKKAVATQNSLGVDTRLIDVDELASIVPGINVEDLEGAAYGPTDGYMDPNSMVAGYAAGARRAGVTIITDSPVTAIETAGGRVTGVRAGSEDIACDVLVNAAGAWAPGIAGLYGAGLPITARRNQIFVLDQTPTPGRNLPLTIDLTTSFYFHSEGSGIVSGYGEAPEVPGAPATLGVDWDPLPMLVERIIHRLPMMDAANVTHAWAGLIETTPDDHPVIGWTHLENVYTVAGFSGHGMSLAPGLARHVAAEIRGRMSELNLDVYRLERFESGNVEPEGVWGGEGVSGGSGDGEVG